MQTKTESVRILVVDDEEIMLKLACDALRSQGHQVTGASGASEALDRLRQERFDFILTDIKMPEMDGLELIQAAHQMDPSMGAIFMTGFASLDTAKKAIQEGAYDYILKPFDLQEIRHAVTRAIQKRSQSIEDGRKKGLSQIFDLNRILYTAGDSKSLLKLSLEFALIQSRLKSGIILYWHEKAGEIQSFQAIDLKQNLFVWTTTKTDPEAMQEGCWLKEIPEIRTVKEQVLFPQLVSLLGDSLAMQPGPDLEGEAILIPLRKGESTTGVMALRKTGGDQELSEEDIKILTILGIQTAISLENLTLLLETKKSYKELQSLQEQIIGLEKMATQGRISAEIGHELNNYLTVIMGNFQMLGMKISHGDVSSLDKQLQSISASLEKIRKFAEGLLDFTSLKAEKTECDVNDLIEKTVAFVKPQSRFKNIVIVTELKPHLPRLVADAGQMQQVLYNLLNNAADAMGKRRGEGGKITIGTDYHSPDQVVEIWVKDMGKGMSQDELSKIFDAGFTTKETGHGMGLSICKKIMDHHGATIQAESELNVGTTFRIRLPVR
ncbi:MAG: response regulator [Candidatus Zixiibacteriota bacterium]